jgi:predicted peroxiredoxin
LGALGALEAGHQAQIALQGEATFLAKEYLVEQIHGVGWPPLSEVMANVIEQEIPIYI